MLRYFYAISKTIGMYWFPNEDFLYICLLTVFGGRRITSKVFCRFASSTNSNTSKGTIFEIPIPVIYISQKCIVLNRYNRMKKRKCGFKKRVSSVPVCAVRYSKTSSFMIPLVIMGLSRNS